MKNRHTINLNKILETRKTAGRLLDFTVDLSRKPNVRKTAAFGIVFVVILSVIFSSVGFFGLFQKTVYAQPGATDGHTIYSDGNVTSLYNNSLSGTAFGTQGSLTGIGGIPNRVDIEASPTDADRLLRGFIDDTNFAVGTSIFDFGTGVWTELVDVSANVGTELDKRFDIEFEESTGDALIVYTDETAASLRYRTMDSAASTWSAQQTLTFAGGGTIKSIVAARDPDTDDIMVAWEDSNFDYRTALWDGAAFGAITTHNVAAGDGVHSGGLKNGTPMGIAWEGGASVSEAIFAWYYDAAAVKVRYNTWTAGAWGTSADIANLGGGGATGKGGGLYLSTRWSEDHSYIGIAAADGQEKILRGTVWNGTAWDTVIQISTGATVDPGKGKRAELVWQRTTGDLYVLWNDKTNVDIQLKRWDYGTTTWQANQAITTHGTALDGQLSADASRNSDYISVVYSSKKNTLGTFGTVFNGTSWSAPTTLQSSTPLGSGSEQDVVYFDGTQGADVTVATTGTQTASMFIPSTNNYVGGDFTITETTSSRNVTGITITENGTVDALNNLANAKLFYDLDTTTPYDCASESYAGTEPQFGTATGFSAADGTASFTGTVAISTTQTMCVYSVVDVGSGAGGTDTLEIEITDPSTDVTVDGGGVVEPNTAMAIAGTTNLDPPNTTISDGIDPGNSTVEPGTGGSYIDQFAFITDASTDSVTALTVTTASTTAIASVGIWNDAMTTQYFATSSVPTGDNWSFSGGTPIPVTTATSSYRVIFAPKDHASLAAGTYPVTGTVTAFTSTNSQLGTDTDSATITVDNTPPADATWGTITPGDQQITLNWTNPGDADFNEVVILRATSTPITDFPTDGNNYSAPGSIGTSAIIYVGALETYIDTGLTNGTNYYYKIFSKDTYRNYASGSETGPHAPVGTTTLGDGTDPGNSTVEPGTGGLYLNQFTFSTSNDTDSVTALTVTSANTSAIASMGIWDDTMTTQYFATSSSPAGNDWNFSGGTAIPVATTSSAFRVVFVSKDHATLSAGTYAVTGNVTSFTSTNNQSGTDFDSATITVDNAPPANATWSTITPGDGQIYISWNGPGDPDFSEVVVLRATSSPITDSPTDGTDYSAPGTIGTSAIVYVGANTNYTDTDVVNGTDYWYKIFSKDTYRNYASGIQTGPHQPTLTPITTIGDGTDPGNSTTEPGTASLYLDQFTFQTNTGSDSVTALTVTTASTTAIANVQIWNDAMSTQYFTTVSSPSGNNWNFSGGTAVPAGTSIASFRVVFTAKSHASLGAGTYAVTGNVTSFTSTNGQAGTDTDSATITIDNTPPADASWGTITPQDGQIVLNWTNPGDADFNEVVILRNTASISDAPTDGTDYSAPGTIGTSDIVYVGALETFTDTGVTNGNNYWYKVFSKDTYKNYASGVETGPHMPNPDPITTIGDGTDPGNSTQEPGTGGLYLDQFSFSTNIGTDSVTALTVTSASTTAISTMEIWNDAMTTQYFSTVSVPAGDNWNFSGGTPIPASTTIASFRVRFTPKDHASLAEGTYPVTGNVTSFTSTNPQSGSDTDSATITVDNTPPADATWGTITPGDSQIVLNWTNPGDADFSEVVVLRATSTPVIGAPTDGTDYSTPGSIGTSTIMYVGALETYTDTTVTNDISYYYKIFSKDLYRNYASGVGTGPHTPTFDPLITLGDGTDPGNSTQEPGTGGLYLDQFTFITATGTDSVTALTVTTASTTAIASMGIWDNTMSTQYFATSSSPVGDDWNFSGGTPIPAATTSSVYRVVFAAKSHAALAAGTYPVTGNVTSFTSTSPQAGSDMDSATITVDNTPPANAIWDTITSGDGQIDLNWTNPGDADFNEVVILRATSTSVADSPTDGTDYSVPGSIGTSTIIYVGSGANYTDTNVANGTSYYYKIFSKDTYRNYASGSEQGPYTPAAAGTGAPRIIGYQGRLMDSDGNLLGGAGTNYCFKFSIYDDSVVGAPDTKLWPSATSSTMTINVKNGVFDAGIGDTDNGGDLLDYNFQDSDRVFLDIEVATMVGGDCNAGDEVFETLSPRQRIYSSGYGINARTVGGYTASQSASGNEITALTNGNFILGGVNPQINATGSNNLILQGGAGTGDIQFFNASSTITSAGLLKVVEFNVVDNTTSGPLGITIENNGAATSDLDMFRIISEVGGANNVKYRIDSDGDVFTDGVTTMGNPADIAENYPVMDMTIEAGDIVGLSDTVIISKKRDEGVVIEEENIAVVEKSLYPYQDDMIGVISTRPGIILSGSTQDSRPVALSGRVPVKVSLENGPIKIGDPITSSSEAGIGMLATGIGKIIGYALEPYNEDIQSRRIDNGDMEPHKILMFINLSYYNGSVSPIVVENDLKSSDAPPPGVLEIVGSSMKNLLGSLTGAVKIAGQWMFGTIEVEEGIVMKDKATGESYCLIVVNGEVTEQKGGCEASEETKKLIETEKLNIDDSGVSASESFSVGNMETEKLIETNETEKLIEIATTTPRQGSGQAEWGTSDLPHPDGEWERSDVLHIATTTDERRTSDVLHTATSTIDQMINEIQEKIEEIDEEIVGMESAIEEEQVVIEGASGDSNKLKSKN